MITFTLRNSIEFQIFMKEIQEVSVYDSQEIWKRQFDESIHHEFIVLVHKHIYVEQKLHNN